MKIYRVIDNYEFKLLKKQKKFSNRTPYIAEHFSTFIFNRKQSNRVYFFLNLLDAKEFGCENLINNYYICEFEIDENLVSSYLGVGIYYGCNRRLKFELLIPNEKINKHFNSFKIVAKVKNGRYKIENINFNNYNEILCENFLGYYKIAIQCYKFNGNYFEPNNDFNKKMLEFIS
ncbi:MAG: hypothetical protein IJX26_02190 [Clostridia bacterium]|nr:hypothetical protein [Clostridia bacterium]